jgi:hypothetical protein
LEGKVWGCHAAGVDAAELASSEGGTLLHAPSSVASDKAKA